MVVQLGSGECSRVVSYSATAIDNCSAAPVITDIEAIKSGSLFDIGTYNLGFRATDSSGNTSDCRFSILVKEHFDDHKMTCISEVNISLGQECHTLMSAGYFLSGDQHGCFEKSYSVQLQTMGGAILADNYISDSQIGTTLRAIVTENTTGNTCNSTFNIFDRLPPTIQAPASVAIACDKIGTDGFPSDSITGKPMIVNECSLPISMTYNDQAMEVNCAVALTAPPAGFPADLPFDPFLAQNAKRIIVRTFNVSDRYNNTSYARQVIYVKAGSLNDVVMPDGRDLTCGNERTAPSDTIIDGILVKGTGYPTLPNNQPLSESYCRMAMSFSDVRTPNPGGGGITILRTWFLSSACTDQTRTGIQTITLHDKAPTFSLVQNTVLQIPPIRQLIVRASDLVAQLSDDCTPVDRIVYGIRMTGTGTGFPNSDSLLLDCSRQGISTVEVWVKDEGGNAVYGTTTLDVRDDSVNCPPNAISGMIRREDNMEIQTKIVLYNAANDSINGMMDANYYFKELLPNTGYRVVPTRPNMDWTNGVTSYDLALINWHILGVKEIASPYNLIGADVNRDGLVDALDMLLIRRLILHIDSGFPNNNSWRFILKDYHFSDPSAPFASSFPESWVIPNLSNSSVRTGDFVAIKVGDVNLSAGSINIRGGAKPFILSVDDRDVEKGKAYLIPIRLKPTRADFNGSLTALQFSLNIDKKASQIEYVAKGDLPNCNEGNIGIFKNEGLVTAAWNSLPDHKFVETDTFTIFNLVITPTENTRLSRILSMNAEYTEGIAYDAMGTGVPVNLSFSNEYGQVSNPVLLPNRPNPFSDETTISFILPETGFARLTVYDLMGKEVMTTEKTFYKGLNEVLLDSRYTRELASGVLVVRLQTGNGTAVQQIVLSR